MKATLVFHCVVALDMDLCTALCIMHNRVLALTSGFSDYGSEEDLLKKQLQLWSRPLSVLSCSAERPFSVPLHSCSILFQPQMLEAFLF